MRNSGSMCWGKLRYMGLETLVNRKAMLLVTVLGKMADRMESARSVPTVTRGTVPLARTRTALMHSMCSLICVSILSLSRSS